MQDIDKIQEHIKSIMTDVLPDSFNLIVTKNRGFLGGSEFLILHASPSFYNINDVKGQLPQHVSLSLHIDPLGLTAGGGRSFHRNIRPDLFPVEKYHALGSVRVPFRKPKGEIKFIYRAVERFFTNYLALLIEWKDDLRHKEHGDYSFLLNTK